MKRLLAALATSPALPAAAGEPAAPRDGLLLAATVAKMLGLGEWDEDAECWWLPAEPDPIECETLAIAVTEFCRLLDNERALRACRAGGG